MSHLVKDSTPREAKVAALETLARVLRQNGMSLTADEDGYLRVWFGDGSNYGLDALPVESQDVELLAYAISRGHA
jgi:hypothetical protein